LRFCCCFITPYICSCLCSDEEDEDDDGEEDLPPGTPRVHSKVSVVATLADLKDNVMHKELAQKVSFSFSNKATDTFNISVVWGRLYNAQKTHIIQNFSGFEVGHELKPDEEHTVDYAFVPHKQLEAGAEYFLELLGYFTPLVNTQSKHYIHTAFNATVKLQEKPGKFTGPIIFSVSLICIIVGGLYMIKNQIGPFSNKKFVPSSKSSSKTSSDDGEGFLDKQHARNNLKKVSSK
jgi:hypothetical protein